MVGQVFQAELNALNIFAGDKNKGVLAADFAA